MVKQLRSCCMMRVTARRASVGAGRRPQMVQGLAVLFLSLASCTGDPVLPVEPVEDPSKLFWTVALNHRAINLSIAAPHDTFRLVATPRTADGTLIEGASPPLFSSADSLRVSVSADGLVRGLQSATRVQVSVSVTQGNVTHTNAAFVNVTADSSPPVLAQFSLEPLPADSAKGALEGHFFQQFYYARSRVVPRALDSQGNTIPNLAVWIESSDPLAAASFPQGRPRGSFFALNLLRPGRVAFYAHTLAYGIERVDTLEYTVGLPLFGAFFVRTQPSLGNAPPEYRFDPSTITVSRGAYVWWLRLEGDPAFDITFEDPTHVARDERNPLDLACSGGGEGNIAPFGDGTDDFQSNACARYFPTPGTYRFRSVALNASGTIIVRDESQSSADLAAASQAAAHSPFLLPSRREAASAPFARP